MNLKAGLFIVLTLYISFAAAAAEFSEGALKLVLNEGTGRFSLYYTGEAKAQALFADEDPRSSFLSVMVNDRSYKMGDSFSFKTRLAADGRNPAFIFESPSMTVTEEFAFMRSPDSVVPNAVKILITLENRGEQQVNAGARFLLDTNLSEKISGLSFSTNQRTVASETLLTRTDGDQYWSDRNNALSLSGSFITGSSADPDSIHIANWKKLNDVSWKAAFQAGRNFNFPPYSIGDSAVCYYFEPAALGRGEKRSVGFILALNYEKAFNFAASSSSVSVLGRSAEASAESILNLTGENTGAEQQDLAALRELIAAIEIRIQAGTATDEEITSIEFALNKLRAKYGSGNNVR